MLTYFKYLFLGIRSSEVLFNPKSVNIYIYIYNSDKIIMSHENLKNFTYAFCKSGALQHLRSTSEASSLMQNLWTEKTTNQLEMSKLLYNPSSSIPLV
jgi:ribonuclease HIII